MAAESGGEVSSSFISPYVEIEFSDLDFYERCGSGAFGSVYRAQWKSQSKIVAVKKLLILEKEAQVLSVLSHRNIIKFYGAVTVPPNFCIITEYADNGSLYDFLAQQQNDSMLSFEQILHWSIDIASGMNYLHEEAPVKVIHRDLKSKNVVISNDFICKICDFGASKFFGNTTKMSLAGTLPWMAPEAIQGRPVSESCDVWSYGVVLWELLTHEMPFKGIEGFQIAWSVVEKGERLTIPSTCPPKFADIMNHCWKSDPKERPSFRQLLKVFQHMCTDESLCDQASVYLSQRSVWRGEIEAALDLMKEAERDLNVKQKQLEEWENRLLEKEEQLERQRFCSNLYEHDVRSWADDDVYLWIKQLGNEPRSKDLEQYADIFLQQHITGERLLLITPDDLKDMGVTSVGHRIHLMNEIERLRVYNKRMVDFPPLQPRVQRSPSPSISPVRPKNVHLALLFGHHVKHGAASSDQKWKMFLEVDVEEGALTSVACIKEVTFECQQAGLPLTRLTHPPYVMDRWCVGITPDTVVTCIVTYESIVRRPRFTRHCHQVTGEGGTAQQVNVSLIMRQIPDIGTSNRSKTRTQCRSAPIVQNAWKNRFFPSSLPTTEGPYVPSDQRSWARVASGDHTIRPSSACQDIREDFPTIGKESSSSSSNENVLGSARSLGLRLMGESPLGRLSSELSQRRRERHRKVFFDFNDSSSSESLNCEHPLRHGSPPFVRARRSSTPTRRNTHQRPRYRHSSSDTGFFRDVSPDDPFCREAGTTPKLVRIRECRIRLQHEFDRMSSLRRQSSETFRNTDDPFEDNLLDRFNNLSFGWDSEGSRLDRRQRRRPFNLNKNREDFFRDLK